MVQDPAAWKSAFGSHDLVRQIHEDMDANGVFAAGPEGVAVDDGDETERYLPATAFEAGPDDEDGAAHAAPLVVRLAFSSFNTFNTPLLSQLRPLRRAI